jgi:membrane protease YdiL (CAAX protease family)
VSGADHRHGLNQREPLFFRGALYTALGDRRPAARSTALYCLVTVATLNVALVAAALVMGTVFSAERRATRGVLAPILTHLTWSALVIYLLPR